MCAFSVRDIVEVIATGDQSYITGIAGGPDVDEGFVIRLHNVEGVFCPSELRLVSSRLV